MKGRGRQKRLEADADGSAGASHGVNGRWAPQPGPQYDAIMLGGIPELFYGGARGGGKSSFLLGDFCADGGLGHAWKGLLLRCTFPELEELIHLSHEIVPACFPTSEWKKQEKLWVLPSGATLKMRSLDASEDASAYLGHAYTWIGWDELGSWKDDQAYLKLFACLRSAAKVSVKRVRATGNPGGVGHSWIKARFVDPAPLGYRPIRDTATGMTRVFVPSRLEHNKILLARDPGYIDRLRGVGTPELVRAWLEGDWNAVVGSFFPEFGQRHVVRPFQIPPHWLRFRSFDWGSARPFACLWLAVSDGVQPGIPAGALVVYRELYGATGPGSNIGLRLPVEDVADMIREAELGDEQMTYSMADPAIFQNDGGPSIGERFAAKKVFFRGADNRRTGKLGASAGWDLIRHRLNGDDGAPMLYMFSTCVNLIRTLPALQHDPAKPEDCDTRGDDHACFVENTMVNGFPVDAVGYLTRCATETTLVQFEDGFSVECTPDHRFLTETGEWTRADQLLGRCISSALPARNSWASAITSAVFTISATAVDCIARCGNTIADLYRRAVTSITSIMTEPTIELATCGSCLAAIINPITASSTTSAALFERQPRMRWLRPQNGTPAKKAAPGIDAMGTLSPLTKPRAWSRWFAKCAGNLSRHGLSARIARNSAISTVKCVRCVAVEPQPVRRNVYCLATDTGWLQLANGAIAANCDALRYACASRPWLRTPRFTRNHVTIDDLWRFRETEQRRLDR